jgi:glucosamine--fructose-6-phosphate aminotransferase (isomerizing)
MCGITAFIGRNVFDAILKSLYQLQNRGYDSAGIMTLLDNHCHLVKFASTSTQTALERLNHDIFENNQFGIGIGHTRWATHGPKTDQNAHPHLDQTKKFALVHNGIIENYEQIKKFLFENGYTFLSQTDSEVIVQLISYYYDKTKDVEESIRKATSELEGTFALCILSTFDSDRIFCIRKGSPLLIGIQPDYAYICSEVSGFCNLVDKYIILDNNDLCILSYGSNKTIQIQYSNQYSSVEVKKESHPIIPDPFLHWTIKEIMEQPETVKRCLCYGSRISKDFKSLDSTHWISTHPNRSENFQNRKIKLGGLDQIHSSLQEVKHIIILGCGTSFFAGLSVVPLFKKYVHLESVNVYDAAEFQEHDIPRKGKACAILISQSGETKDLYDKITLLKSNQVILLGVINVVDSYIAREMDAGVYLHIGREVGVASTKAFTAQVICLTLIMLWFLENENPKDPMIDSYIESLTHLSKDIERTIEKNHSICKKLAKDLVPKSDLFILAKGNFYSYAQEGSLKLKEIGYIHSEAYGSSSLKHGPYSLIEKGTPVIILCPRDEFFSKHQSVKEEINSRGGEVIGISNDILDDKFYLQMIVPKNKHFFGILSTVVLQLLAYELSIQKGNNPDIPRNLAKVVTVD